MEASITYFEETGATNTGAVLELIKRRAQEGAIRHVVIASTTGATARQAAAAFADTEIKLVIIPHQWRWREERQFDRSLVPELERAGHRVYWSTMLFHTEELYGNSAGAALANILRTFGQGTKVCVEILLMAANGGQIDIGEKVIVAAGSGRGADTALVATAATSNRLKEVRIHEIVCKPLLER